MEKKKLGWARECTADRRGGTQEGAGRGADSGGAADGAGAPFASVEDLSDESPPGDRDKLEVPGAGSGPSASGKEGAPPRIDISRASSSSHHEDSSPERELFGDGSGGVKVGLGFTEDMALELRSSTEELDFHESEPERKTKKKRLHQQQAVVVTKYELDDADKENQERKDSGCSEGGLLFIGGRTSRLSSVGSAASQGSGISAGSAVSRLSAASNYSRASRCSSPHRMLLETSFCGPKPIPTLSLEAEYPPSESVEATLLRRTVDPANAVLPASCTLEVRDARPRRASSERTVRPSNALHQPAVRSSSARTPGTTASRPKRTPKKQDEDALVRIIPLHGSLDQPDDDDDDATEEGTSGTDSKADDFNPEEGIYIPLKGPIIDTRIREMVMGRPQEPPPTRRAVSAPGPRRPASKERTKEGKHKTDKHTSAREHRERREHREEPKPKDEELVKFISLHGDEDEEAKKKAEAVLQQWVEVTNSSQWRRGVKEPDYSAVDLSEWPRPRPRTPEPPKPARLELDSRKNGRSLGTIPRDESRTPSPAASFTRGNIFRRSSDSSGSSKKSMSSSDSKTKKEGRNRSMFTSLFRKQVKEPPVKRAQTERAPPVIDPKLTNVTYTFSKDEKVIDKDTIIIPLHSPDEVVEPLIRYEPGREEDEVRPAPMVSKSARSRPQEPPSPLPVSPDQHPLSQSQRTSSEFHTIERNVIVVDIEATRDPKDRPVRTDPLSPKSPMEWKTPTKDIRSPTKEARSPIKEVRSPIKEVRSPMREARTPIVERKPALEVYEQEPRVRRSSSSCSREGEGLRREEEVRKEEVLETAVVNKIETEVRETAERVSLPEPAEEVSVSKTGSEEVETYSGSGETGGQTSQETVIENHLVRDDSSVRSPTRNDILCSLIPDEEVESLIKKEEDSERSRSEGLEGRKSSGSEVEPLEVEMEERRRRRELEEADEERKGLFHQADSTEDELPYVPTTLPQERSVAVPIIPVKQRTTEAVKTCPVERPRSTTPIQPSNLEEYAARHPDSRPPLQPGEKMQIILPRSDSLGRSRGGKAGGRGQTPSPPPPLPPRSAPPQWVGFDEPERRRPPRRITTLPYSYVNPEECTCECHEAQHVKTQQCVIPASKPGRSEKEKRYRT